MDQAEMRNRTLSFASRVVRLCASLPKDPVGDVLGRQLLKSGTSIGANYREATRASSRKHFVSILQIALREADETDYWLELIVENDLIPSNRLKPLQQECRELIAILAATVRTSKDSRRHDI
ncbi:MAG: four helix bundle protein [Planctomycetota bacterium]